MEKSQSNCSATRTVTVVVSAFVLVLTTSLVTLMLVNMHYMNTQSCHRKLHFQRDVPQYDAIERLNIAEHNVTLVRSVENGRCYLTPLNEKAEERVYGLLHEPISSELLLELAGPYGGAYCDGFDVYMLKELHQTLNRQKRQIELLEGKPPALELEYDERNPRCMDLILDCANNVNQVQTCFTWVNGVIEMGQKCNSATSFTIAMNKPPGRILKVILAQQKICEERRQQGLRC